MSAHAAGVPGSGVANVPQQSRWPQLRAAALGRLKNRWGPELDLGFLLPAITSEAFICMTRGIKMLLVLD